ncbi:MAG: alpha/beta fold hydrolase [Acidimicrobiales bacterium]|nr:alpha/beta fold hydrolase [Acidimicrobiales bacterium]
MRMHTAGRRLTAIGLAVTLGVLSASCSSDDADDADDAPAGVAETSSGGDETEVELPEGYEGYTSENYADDAHWLCKPGITDDVCSRDLDATAVLADGTTEVIEHEVAEDPPVDCFYVYPTTSFDEGPNSDWEPAEAEEIHTVYNQAARLTSTCRVFAPVYRQATLSAIGGGRDDDVEPWTVAYDDVLDAFKDYIVNESDGRGFVLIGHSQGAGMLTRLIEGELDDEPLLRDRLVGAYILGSSVQVPEGEVAGGTFANVPLCEETDQTGCVVSYVSYRATAPPTSAGFFGRAGAGTRAACVNPADLAGGPAPLQPYFLVTRPEGSLLGGDVAHPFDDPARTAEIDTPWVTYPDLVEGTCAEEGDYTYLSLAVNGDPTDPRTDDIGGDLNEQWGMHLIDANVAMGDIVDLVTAQAEGYTG